MEAVFKIKKFKSVLLTGYTHNSTGSF